MNLEIWYNAENIPVYALNGKGFPLLISDVLGISVSDILDFIEADDTLTAVLDLIFRDRTFSNYGKDLASDIFDKEFFVEIRDDKVADFIINIIEDFKGCLEESFAERYIGDVVGL